MTTYGQPALQEEILDAVEESLIAVNLPGRHHIWLIGKQDYDLLLVTKKQNASQLLWQQLEQEYRFS